MYLYLPGEGKGENLRPRDGNTMGLLILKRHSTLKHPSDCHRCFSYEGDKAGLVSYSAELFTT
jgi:hypothetical protein